MRIVLLTNATSPYTVDSSARTVPHGKWQSLTWACNIEQQLLTQATVVPCPCGWWYLICTSLLPPILFLAWFFPGLAWSPSFVSCPLHLPSLLLFLYLIFLCDPVVDICIATMSRPSGSHWTPRREYVPPRWNERLAYKKTRLGEYDDHYEAFQHWSRFQVHHTGKPL